jgi:hypothetical protein
MPRPTAGRNMMKMRHDIADELDRAVNFTSHAIERMMARGILKPTVLAVIKHGLCRYSRYNEIIEYMGWSVVMRDNWVITVFFERD